MIILYAVPMWPHFEGAQINFIYQTLLLVTLLLVTLFFSSALVCAQNLEAHSLYRAPANEQCVQLFHEPALLPKESMQLLLQLHRSWTYGVEILERTSSSGQIQWLVLVSESRYKRQSSRDLGQRLLNEIQIPRVADRETLDTLPLGRMHQILPIFERIINPVQWFSGRVDRLSLLVPAINEAAWQPSGVAQVGWSMGVSKRTIKLLAAAVTLAYLSDLLFQTTTGMDLHM